MLKILTSSICLLTSLSALGIFTPFSALAKEDKTKSVFEDTLNQSSGVDWGGPDLPYRKAVDIKDSLVDTLTGKIVADRYGKGAGNLTDAILGPYFSPSPGRIVTISLWGSKIEGCFVEMIVQYAPVVGSSFDADNAKELTPTLLQLGVGSNVIELPPQSSTKLVVQKRNYVFSTTSGGRNFNIPSNWYMTRNLFQIDASMAEILRSAPAKDSRARLKLASGETLLIPIRKETVAAWKSAYSFNSSCQNPEVAAKKIALKTSSNPLTTAFESYQDLLQQNQALDWLQSQLSAQTMKEFSLRWRGAKPSSPTQPIQLKNASKYYKGLKQQKEALKWLQKILPSNKLDEFVQQWVS
jgi:hypothetical protein